MGWEIRFLSEIDPNLSSHCGKEPPKFCAYLGSRDGTSLLWILFKLVTTKNMGKLIRGNLATLDINHLLQIWPPSMSRMKLDRKLKEEDPYLYLQLDSLDHDPLQKIWVYYSERILNLTLIGG